MTENFLFAAGLRIGVIFSPNSELCSLMTSWQKKRVQKFVKNFVTKGEAKISNCSVTSFKNASM